MEKELTRLVNIMTRLRAPGGCPWDREQTHETLLKCLIEEAYEFCEAVREKDDTKICDELGDIMLQIVFHSEIAREAGRFSIRDVFTSIADKLERRHPHVFGTVSVKDSDEVVANWEQIKKGEKNTANRESVLDGIPTAMPPLLRALKLQKRAAKVGFDWKEAAPVFAKLDEEIGELKAETGTSSHERLADELGDVLFSVVNLARHLKVDPEEALAAANRKFESRFRGLETKIRKSGKKPENMTLAELDALWDAEKASARLSPSDQL